MDDFDETTVIAVKAPPETRLEVPNPAEVRLILPFHCYKKYSSFAPYCSIFEQKIVFKGNIQICIRQF